MQIGRQLAWQQIGSCVLFSVALDVFAQDIIHSITPIGVPAGLPSETAEQIQKSKSFDPGTPVPGLPNSAKRLVDAGVYKSLDCVLQGDRFEYWQDDLNGQFLAILPRHETNSPAKMRLVLYRLDGSKETQVSEASTDKTTTNRHSFLLSIPPLKVGTYRVKAMFLDDSGNTASPEAAYEFRKTDKRNPVVQIPADGIPIVLEKQEFLSDATWPVRTGVPLPINAAMDASQLALFQDGKQVAAQIKPIATWCPKGSVQWVHVDFLGKYSGGTPAEYRLKFSSSPTSPLTSSPLPRRGEEEASQRAKSEISSPPLGPELVAEGLGGEGRVRGIACEQTDDKITVDTGAIRFVVNRKKFAGIEAAWFDPSGAGRYDEANPVIKGAGGPYLVDGRIIRFDAANDTNAVVMVEEQGPLRVTIRAEGWYVGSEGRVDPLCKFVTRITAFAGQPFVRVSQHTILTYDTRQYRLKDAGFHIASTIGEQFRLGADGATKEGPLPAAPKTVFLHQDRYDHFRVVGVGTNEIEGAKSDGWFSLHSNTAAPSPLSSPPAGSGNTNAPSKDGISSPPLGPELVAEGLGGEGRVRGTVLTVVLRDIWQKFPKEVEMGREGLTLHFWPRHGHRAFSSAAELDIKNIYKFWCFHQGQLLDLVLPNEYFDKFNTDYASGTHECRPEHALNGNGQGLAIGNQFEVLFTVAQASSLRSSESPSQPPPGSSRYIAAWAQLFQRDPAAHATPEWNCSTLAMGKIAAADGRNFPAMEEALEQGWLSHTRCVERANEYGMWIWPDTHTYWNAEEDHSELHRVWHNSHYHEVGQTWLMYYRTGSPGLLRWARTNTDHWMNIGTVNYAEYDEEGRPKLKFHVPGAMYHCKGLTPWGSELYGMRKRDGHAGVAGHWTDPDAFLWDWYLSGNPRAWDIYRMWADTYTKAPWYWGTRREANTTFAMMLNYYRATWDPNMLPCIRGMGYSLRTAEPLEEQQPGPMWHVLWINRYYELTRDPEYVPFILKYAQTPIPEAAWLTALASLAYDLSGDKSYLEQHFQRVTDYPRKFFRAPGDPYDWYGVGPGPIGDRWGGYLSWGHFLYALNKAGITDITSAKNTNFGYLVGGKPSLTVYALEKKDQPITLTFSARSLGGDLGQCAVTFRSPSGKELAKFTVPPKGGPSAWTEKLDLAKDGETGLYRFEMNTHRANVTAPLTDLPVETMVVPKDAKIFTTSVFGLLRPSDATRPVDITINSDGVASTRHPCNVILADATGKVLAEASLFAPRKTPPLTFTFDPQKHELPWTLDVHGPAAIRWNGESDKLFLGPSDEALKAIVSALKK